MKKFGSIYRESTEKTLEDCLKTSKSIFIVKYQGVKSPALGQLRQNLTNVKARLFVSKNSLARRVFSDFVDGRLLGFINGQAGFIFVEQDPVAVSKVMKEFVKENPFFVFQGGLLQDSLLSKQDIELLAELPSREVLISMAIAGIKTPVTNLVFLLNQLLLKLVLVIKAISEKKK